MCASCTSGFELCQAQIDLRPVHINFQLELVLVVHFQNRHSSVHRMAHACFGCSECIACKGSKTNTPMLIRMLNNRGRQLRHHFVINTSACSGSTLAVIPPQQRVPKVIHVTLQATRARLPKLSSCCLAWRLTAGVHSKTWDSCSGCVGISSNLWCIHRQLASASMS